MSDPEKPSDPYETFAERYGLFYGRIDEPDPGRVEFLRSLFEEHGVSRVLDCACGTGHDLFWLREAGLSTFGADISAAMLRQARKNLDEVGVRPPIVRADFRASPFRQRSVDAVLCLTTSLPHLANRSEVVASLEEMHNLLRSGGILVLSQGITDRLLKDRPRFIPEINRVDFSRVFVIDYHAERVVIHVLDLLHGPERQEFLVDSFEYLTILPGDYGRLLSEVGFSAVWFHSGFSAEQYDPELSEKLVVVARK